MHLLSSITNFTKTFIIIIGFTLLLSSININPAKANKLMVTPTRVEFEGRTRTQEVKLINKGDEVTSYRISFQHLRMKDDGSYEEIKDGEEMADEKFADDIIRYSPRRVTLNPGEIQTIRLMLRKSRATDGEYRSHMLFREEAPADFGTNIEKSGDNENKISIVLKPLFGISIPIIAKIGDISASATIEEMKIKSDEEGNKLLHVKIGRSGNASTYGDLIVNLTPKNSDKKYKVGILNGVSAFYPYSGRSISIKLNIPENINPKDGTLNVTYYGRQKDNSSTTDMDNILTSKSIVYK